MLLEHEGHGLHERRFVGDLPFPPPSGLTITHNFRELRERPEGQVVDNKKGADDNKL